MLLFKFFTLCVIVHSTRSGSVHVSDEKDNETFLRALRDLTGQYHPELHGDHSHEHSNEIPTTLGVTYASPPFGYSFPPPPPPVDYGGTPNGYANCGCVPKDRCPRDVQIAMVELLRDLKNDVVCGITQYDLCCLKDPWPGQIDIFKPQAVCLPVEHCTRKYGDRPTDVQDYGVIGPCLGLGSVRCLDDKPYPPPGPISIVVPIVDYNPPPPPPVVYQPPTVYEPPVVYVPPTTPPVVYEPPTTPPVVYVPPTTPPVVYEPPTTPPVVYVPPTTPPVVYEPPTSPPVVYVPPISPPVVYEPPVIPPTVYEPPVVYEPPTSPPVAYVPPAVTYEAPVTVYQPPTTYEAPVVVYEPPTTYEAPVTTYEAPVVTYEPPVPVTTYEAPVATYEPPVPVTTYEAPVATYEPPIPATTYGTPNIGNNIGVSLPPRSRSSYLTRYPGYGGHRRYGFPYGGSYSYGYPHSGYGFRKRLGISKYFG